MTALNPSDIENFRKQIKIVPANIATRYTEKILNSIGLNLSLAKSLNIKKNTSPSKI